MINFKSPNGGDGKKKSGGFKPKIREICFEVRKEIDRPALRVLSRSEQHQLMSHIRKSLSGALDAVVPIYCVGFQEKTEREQARNTASDIARQIDLRARPAVLFATPIFPTRGGAMPIVLSFRRGCITIKSY